MHVFAGGAQPLELRSVEETVVLGGIAITSFFDSSSTSPSRIYTHNLREPLSPVLGRVRAWREQPADGSGAQGRPVLISRAMRVDGHPLFRVGHVHLPIDSTGMPLSLPDRAIGVIPIAATPNPESLSAAGCTRLPGRLRAREGDCAPAREAWLPDPAGAVTGSTSVLAPAFFTRSPRRS